MSIRQKTFALKEELAQLRYERPVLGASLTAVQWVFWLTLLCWLAWVVAGSSVGNMLGMGEVRQRITYGYQALQWARKGVPSAETLPVIPQRYGGTIERASKGKVLVTFYDGGHAQRRIVKLANVDVQDEAAFAQWAQGFTLKPVTLDFYLPTEKYAEHDVWATVVWAAKKPINVELVEQGIGTPEINPITTAVNMIFSQWYLQMALGKQAGGSGRD